MRHSETNSNREAIFIPLAAVLVGLTLFALFCEWVGASPVGVFASIYKAGFGSWYSWQNSLVRAAPLMLCGLATAIPARAGMITVGGEGAFVIGGLAATAAGLATATLPPLASLTVMVIAGAIAGGAWLAIAAGLHHYRGVNAVISSLLLNYIGIAVLLQMVEGPMRDPASLNFPATFAIAESHQLGHIGGSRIHSGLIFGIVACLLAWFLMERTAWGMKAKVVGGNARTALLIGLPLGQIVLTAGFLGGACAGVAGMVEVAAIHGRASQSISAGYGYVGVLVAFLARHSPLRVLVVSIVLGAVLASAGILQRDHDLPDATISVLEGIAFLTVLASETFYGRTFRLGIFTRSVAHVES
jgi:general nucleoside transport system permease protein